MKESFDKKKMMQSLLDQNVSVILTELEDDEKNSTYLENKLQLSDHEIKQRLSYVIEHGFVKMIETGKKTTFSVDKKKLDDIMATDEHFTSIVDGLTEINILTNIISCVFLLDTSFQLQAR